MKPSYAPDSNVRAKAASFGSDLWAGRTRNYKIFVVFLLCGWIIAALENSLFSIGLRSSWLWLGALIIGAAYLPSPAVSIKPLKSFLKQKLFRFHEGHSHNGDESEKLFRSVFDHATGMALAAPDGRWLAVNQSLCQSLGYSEHELLSTSFQQIAHPDDVSSILIQINKLLVGSISSYQVEQRYLHKLGHSVWVLLHISLVPDAKADEARLIFQLQDITDRKQAEERLVHDVFHDALTGLPNRALFMDRLKLATERAKRRKDQVFAVLFLDLDRFKTINDSLGHIIGDQLLIEIARRLKDCLRTTDTIARLGGDEFTILLEDLADDGEAVRIVERLQRELERPFKLGVHNMPVTASIGLVCNTAGYDRAEDILRDADSAMYRAKSAGKARYEVFDRAKSSSFAGELDLQADLAQAIQRRELLLYYQPIVSLEAGRLLGFEALVRWKHPRRGMISPVDFIPLAEDTGAIVVIGQWVLREACLQLRRWQEEFPMNQALFMSVNLSSKQLIQADLIDQVIDILRETDVDPRRLKLEITESAVMENISTATVILQQLRALGVELSIDDFGTGYSSLSTLHKLPINTLKIDRSFVTGIAENTDDEEIVKTIVTLARGLGMSVIAEGVETVEQLAQLRRLKCGSAQGYLFSKPCEAERAAAFVGAGGAEWQTTIAAVNKSRLADRVGSVQTRYDINLPSSRSELLRAV